MSLSYRLAEEEDFPALQNLWMSETNWGALTQQMWKRYVVDAPLGGVSGTIAVDDDTGEIVGEFVFMPSLVTVFGREYRAFRPGAPILAKSLRFRSPNLLSHPIVRMYMHAVRALRDRGDGLIYMVPDPRWLRFFRMFPALTGGSFPLWRLDVPLAQQFKFPDGYTSRPISDFGDESIDRLWKVWSQYHKCSVVRDSRSLPWKIGYGDYDVLGIEHADELVGLVASRKKGDKQWLVCDVLAADCDRALRATLLAVSNLASDRALASGPNDPVRKVAVLVTPPMEQIVRSLGFVRDSYDFPLVVHILNKAITKQEISPSNWYVSAND